MGRAKLPIKQLDSPLARQITFAKRKSGIMKKAAELSLLCNIDLAIIMFSPSGRLTTFSSNGSVEDVLIRLLCNSYRTKGASFKKDENLLKSFMRLKYEAQIMELLANKENLEVECNMLRRQLNVVQDTMSVYKPALKMLFAALHGNYMMCEGEDRKQVQKLEVPLLGMYYNPSLYPVRSIHQAEVSEKSITDALQYVKQVKEKFLGNHISEEATGAIENIDGHIPEGEIAGADADAGAGADSDIDGDTDADYDVDANADADQRNEEFLEYNPILPRDHQRENPLQETRSSLMGPHLNTSFIRERSNWNLPGSMLPFKEIVGHELSNASPDEQQNMGSGPSGVCKGGLIGKPGTYGDLFAGF